MSGCITSKYPINYSNWPWKNMKTTQDFSSTSTSVVISAAASTTLALEDKVSAGTRKPGRRASRGGPVGWNLWDLARTTLTKSKTSGFWSKLLSKFQLVPLLQHSTRKKFSPGTVFWPREIVAKGHSHPWAIPWFCTPHGVPSTSAARTSFSVRTPKAAVDWWAARECFHIPITVWSTEENTPLNLAQQSFRIQTFKLDPNGMVVDSNDQPFMGSNSYPWPDHSPDRTRFYTLLAPDHCPRLPQSPVAGWHSKQL